MAWIYDYDKLWVYRSFWHVSYNKPLICNLQASQSDSGGGSTNEIPTHSTTNSNHYQQQPSSRPYSPQPVALVQSVQPQFTPLESSTLKPRLPPASSHSGRGSAYREKIKKAPRQTNLVDLHSRWAFPFVYIIFNVCYWMIYLVNRDDHVQGKHL